MSTPEGATPWQGVTTWQERLDDIHRESDPGIRNILITRMYYQLGRSMDALLGGQDANWLTFGTWASHTAGRFIRGEGLPVSWGAQHVADGNLAIIDDIAPCFIAYLATVHGAAHDREQPLFSMGLECIGGSEYLADAFDCYEQVRHQAPDSGDVQRAQLILRANVSVAYHEQWLADCFIDRAMPLGGLFGIASTRFVQLHLPQTSLDLCDPVPCPDYLHGRMWPEPLDTIQDPSLERLYQRIGQDPQDVDGSAARSWEDFDDRMGFIAVFFRAYQRDPALHAFPSVT